MNAFILIALLQVNSENSAATGTLQDLQRPTLGVDNLFHDWQAMTSSLLFSGKEGIKDLLSFSKRYTATATIK